MESIPYYCIGTLESAGSPSVPPARPADPHPDSDSSPRLQLPARPLMSGPRTGTVAHGETAHQAVRAALATRHRPASPADMAGSTLGLPVDSKVPIQ